MALVQKTSPKGIDIIINSLQAYLFNGLTATGIGWTKYQSYPRANKNETDNGLIVEFYTDNNEPKDVYTDDDFNASSFFLVGDTIESTSDTMYSVDIKIIFQVDLSKLYPLIPHTADEEMHRDVIILLEKNPFTDGTPTKITTGIRKIYSDEGLIKTDGFEDMSNLHVVKFDLKINYAYNC